MSVCSSFALPSPDSVRWTMRVGGIRRGCSAAVAASFYGGVSRSPTLSRRHALSSRWRLSAARRCSPRRAASRCGNSRRVSKSSSTREQAQLPRRQLRHHGTGRPDLLRRPEDGGVQGAWPQLRRQRRQLASDHSATTGQQRTAVVIRRKVNHATSTRESVGVRGRRTVRRCSPATR